MRNHVPRDESQPSPTVVVPLDGSTHALAALPIAKALAKVLSATLHVVHVARRTLPPRAVLQALGLEPTQFRGSVLDQTVGSPALGIVQTARTLGSVLIVMCTRTATVPACHELGTVAEEVLLAAPCSVVLVRPERGLEPWTLHQMLVPHDGTPTTAAAIHPAAVLAECADAELLVLHVAAPGAALPTAPGAFTAPRYLDQPQHEWPSWAHEVLERMRALGHVPTAVKLHLFLATGEPGTAIVHFARDHQSDLIVLAWHGHLAERRAQTLKAIVKAAPCPVLVVRVPE